MADRSDPARHGRVIAVHGGTLLVEDADRAVWRCVARQTAGKAVCGDEVEWSPQSDGTGVVSKISPRRTVLERCDEGGRRRPICANLDQLIIVTAVRRGESAPARAICGSRDLVDCYLAAAELLGIRAVIVVNKVDLLEDGSASTVTAATAPYHLAGYAIIRTSALTGQGIAELRTALRDHRSVLAGESGVGKSSLIQYLLPDREIRVGAVAAATGKGRHTTTATILFHLPGEGDIIDSPGVREFGLWAVPPDELAAGFREFARYRADCRYRDCRHAEEPGCAVAAAAARDEISRERLDAYRRMLRSLASRTRPV